MLCILYIIYLLHIKYQINNIEIYINMQNKILYIVNIYLYVYLHNRSQCIDLLSETAISNGRKSQEKLRPIKF